MFSLFCKNDVKTIYSHKSLWRIYKFYLLSSKTSGQNFAVISHEIHSRCRRDPDSAKLNSIKSTVLDASCKQFNKFKKHHWLFAVGDTDTTVQSRSVFCVEGVPQLQLASVIVSRVAVTEHSFSVQILLWKLFVEWEIQLFTTQGRVCSQRSWE